MAAGRLAYGRNVSESEAVSDPVVPTPDRGGLSIVDRRLEQAPERTLIDVFRATASRYPESAAIEDPAGTLVYSELVAEVDGTARRLWESGVRAGDRVGVRLPSGSRGLYVAILSVLAAVDQRWACEAAFIEGSYTICPLRNQP